MSLFKRNNKPSLGDQRAEEVNDKGLSGILASDPMSPHFLSPIKAPDSKRIYQYFVAVQMERYGKIVDLPEPAVKRHISLALQEYAPVWVIRAIKYTSWISSYPFSVPFAVKSLKDLESKQGYSFSSGVKKDISSFSLF